VIQQYLNLGVVEELEIALAPVLSAVGGVSSRTSASPVRSFVLTGLLMVQLPRTCAMCVSQAAT
jgi:hypothetical protein